MSEKQKLKIISLSIEPETHTLLTDSAKKLGYSTSKLIRELVQKYLSLIVSDEKEIPVILKIPVHFKADEDSLRKWLAIKQEALVKALCKD